jgi:hypothetical protein
MQRILEKRRKCVRLYGVSVQKWVEQFGCPYQTLRKSWRYSGMDKFVRIRRLGFGPTICLGELGGEPIGRRQKVVQGPSDTLVSHEPSSCTKIDRLDSLERRSWSMVSCFLVNRTIHFHFLAKYDTLLQKGANLLDASLVFSDDIIEMKTLVQKTSEKYNSYRRSAPTVLKRHTDRPARLCKGAPKPVESVPVERTRTSRIR